uniref:RING-type E3 ubiquitin transferase n=2 Tax=Chrysotila carterae TaxID=13221 RepID=A0A6T0BYF9_CHRCT
MWGSDSALNCAATHVSRRGHHGGSSHVLVSASTVRWQWHCHGHEWADFAPGHAVSIEGAFNAHVATLHLNISPPGWSASNTPLTQGAAQYTIDLNQMLQMNTTSGFQRRIRRASADATEAWSWKDDRGAWQPYEVHACGQLSAALRAGWSGTVLHAGKSAYHVDFHRLEQLNTQTGKRRPVARQVGAHVSAAGLPQTHSNALHACVGHGAHSSPVLGLPVAFGAAPVGLSVGSAASLFVERFCAEEPIDLARATGWRVLLPSEWGGDERVDAISLEALGEGGQLVVRLPCSDPSGSCIFNVSTLEQSLGRSGKCPACGHAYPVRGPQPSGCMRASVHPRPCAGHEASSSIELTYAFATGVQRSQHPSEGRPYAAVERRCVYPNDAVGGAAVMLLRLAFRRGLAFRIGDSATTGKSGVVVWAIHQKSRRDGGTTRHGWPDGTYLTRLKHELVLAGIAVETVEAITERAHRAATSGNLEREIASDVEMAQ